MSGQHTPGPWHVGGKSEHPIVYGPDGFAVADATVFHGTFKEGETEANALLIAAAPELLEALEAICAEASSMSMTMRRRKIFDAGKAAIAKARAQ